jgi:hypothetical protein
MVFSLGSPLTSLSLSKSAWLLFWHRSPTTVCGRTPKSGVYLIGHFYVFTSKGGSHTILSSAEYLIKVVRRTVFGVTPFVKKMGEIELWSSSLKSCVLLSVILIIWRNV